jgi:Secretory lipase
VSEPSHAPDEFVGPPPHAVDFARPLPPRDDPFCRAPAGFEAAAPGTVLRSRQVRLAFLGIVPQAVFADQLLYRTTDLTGAPQAAITTVIRPARGRAGKEAPVVSYQCAIDAVASTGFPSYVLRHHAKLAKVFGGPPAWEFVPMACALSRGWRVLVPDHGGARGRWIAPREPGYCVLDGIRAAQNFEPAAIARGAPVALWGYSGGGLATGWAAELWASYATELNIVGAVLGAPVGDPGEVFRDLDGSLYAGLPNMAVASLMREYPDLRRLVETHADASGQSLLARLEGMSMIAALARGCLRRSGSFLDRPLEEILATPEIARLFDELRLGRTAPAIPVLILQAIHDQFINVRHIDALADDYRAGGAQVSYLRDRLSEHALLFPLSVPTALRWISDRFAVKPDTDPGTRTVALLISPRTIAGVLATLWITLKLILGRELHA